MKVIQDTNECLDWNPNECFLKDHIVVKYKYKTKIENKEAAHLLCREQSTSTWNRLHQESKNIRKRRAAKLLSLDEKYFSIAYPVTNIHNQLSDLLVTIIGNGSFLNTKIFSELYIVDISFPNSYLENFNGPKYGTDILGWFSPNIPLLIGVQKPSIGLSAKTHIKRALDGLLGGCDIVKEDEQLRPYDNDCNILDRIKYISRELPKVIRKNKRHMMYVFNICSDLHLEEYINMIEEIQICDPYPIFGIMVSLSQGLPSIRKICDKTSLPVLLHPSGIGLYTRGSFGISPEMMILLMRLAGNDIIIYPTPFSKISNCSQKEANNILHMANKAHNKIKKPIISFGCGVNTEVIEKIHNCFNNEDYSLLVGGAIYGDLNGPYSGSVKFKKKINMVFNCKKET